MNWLVALRPGKRAQWAPKSRLAGGDKAKAEVQAKVEHPFKYKKIIFGHSKFCCRALAEERKSPSLGGGIHELAGRKRMHAGVWSVRLLVARTTAESRSESEMAKWRNGESKAKEICVDYVTTRNLVRICCSSDCSEVPLQNSARHHAELVCAWDDHLSRRHVPSMRTAACISATDKPA
jgi:hypothetical protein